MMDKVASRIGKCPRCGQGIRLDATNPWRPFCSRRCKLVDLGEWLDGRYRLPAEESAPQDHSREDQ